MVEASFQTAHWVLWIQLVCSGSPKSLLRYLIYEELDVSIGFMSHISKGKHVKSTSESWVKVLHFERKLSSIFLQ